MLRSIWLFQGICMIKINREYPKKLWFQLKSNQLRKSNNLPNWFESPNTSREYCINKQIRLNWNWSNYFNLNNFRFILLGISPHASRARILSIEYSFRVDYCWYVILLSIAISSRSSAGSGIWLYLRWISSNICT